MKKLLLIFCTWLLRFTYEPVTLDKVNKKLIRPVEGLVIDGVQYYEFVNVADMPEARAVHYNHFRRELALNMSTDQAVQYLDQMEEANDEGNKSLAGMLIYMMRDTIKNCTPVEVLYNLAALMYFDKQEDISCFDVDYNTKKIERFKTIPNQTFFFDRLIRRGLRSAGNQSANDIEEYLKRSRVKLKTYQRVLTDLSDKKTSSTLSEP